MIRAWLVRLVPWQWQVVSWVIWQGLTLPTTITAVILIAWAFS